MSNYWSIRFPQPLFFSVIALIASCVFVLFFKPLFFAFTPLLFRYCMIYGLVLLVINTFVFAAEDFLYNYSVFKESYGKFNVFIHLHLQSIPVFKTCSNSFTFQINELFSLRIVYNVLFFTQNQVLVWFFAILGSLLLLLLLHT